MSTTLADHFAPSRPNGLGWPIGSLVVVDTHRLLYRPISKNACTSLKRLMLSLSDTQHKELLLADRIHTVLDEYDTGLLLHDRDRDEAERIISGGEYFSFAVVRDPFTRLLSAYREKFVVNRTVPANQQITRSVVAAVQGTEQPDLDRGVSFADFTRHVVSVDPMTLNPHWRPQVLFLEGVDYDRLFRFEALGDLADELGHRVGHQVTLEVKNRSRSWRSRRVRGAASLDAGELRKARSVAARSFMDDDLMTLISEHFARDYAVWEAAG